MSETATLASWGRRSALAVAAALALAGCGDQRTAQLVPVQGVVRQGGRPLTSGQVMFVPVPPHQAPLGFGDIQADGRYTVLSANRYAGVRPGSYAVCVQATDEAAKVSESVDPMLRPVTSLVPSAYLSYATTPLRCDVPPSGTTFDIDLPAGGRGN